MTAVMKQTILKSGLLASCLLGLSTLVSSPANAAIFFQDNFDSETANIEVTSLTNWNVVGNVDVIGDGLYDFYPGNGLYLDLDGSASSATIETKQIFNFLPGTYELAFSLGINPYPFNPYSAVLVKVGSLFSETFLAPDTLTSSYTSYKRLFTVTAPTSATLSFQELGSPNYAGSILDNVSLASVPEPSSLVGLLAVSAAGCLAIRKRNQAATHEA